MSQNSRPDANDADKLKEWVNQQLENKSDSSSRNFTKGVAEEFGAIGAGVANELGRIALGVVTLGLSEESKDKD
ncbi:hypothetical protein QUB67_14590 [Microcoleus sp. ARI1-A1]